MTPEERINALAAERGGVATIPPRRAAQEPTTTKAVAAMPIELTRKAPTSWKRAKFSDDVKDYRKRDKRETLSTAETRVMAWLICRALPGNWRKEFSENDRLMYLVHETGFRLSFRKMWQNIDRYRISPQDCKQRRDDDIPDEITVDASRSPANIARDIDNRILSKGAIESWELVQLGKRERWLQRVNERLSVLSLAVALGRRQIARESRWKSSCCPQTNVIHVDDMSVTAELSYLDRYQLTIETASLEKARKLCEVIRTL